ncbi:MULTISPECIES: TIGR00730 family Rossman fold protein [unclassified Corynebacterium]|uniref:TIGR00730 family Rossman fold protein n=1 Tax=unclassified Corynebacterium TaxID=2624378 RepID=UPI00309BB3DE
MITVAAIVVTNDDGHVLTVRKRGTDRFMLPGGKFEPGESTDHPEVTALREFEEELGVALSPTLVRPWGIARDSAANEPGEEVVGFHVRYDGPTPEVAPRAEIAEVRWVDPHHPTGRLAPMLVSYTLPKLSGEKDRGPRIIESVTVFCGSSCGDSPLWQETAAELGHVLGRERIELVYGGASCGLMGTVAAAAMNAGGEVVGVMPRVLGNRERTHHGLTRLEEVETMAERKHRMYELGQAFITLPGGAGTLEEFFEVWTQQHIGMHAKPVALLGPNGFWQPLVDLLRNVSNHGFIRRDLVDALIVVESVDELLPALSAWTSPGTKWT